MSEGNGSGTEDLAYLLWEKQGRPENRSAQNWIEAEYLAGSLANVTRDENEVDLRMRGLGPLTQGDSLPRNGDAQQSENEFWSFTDKSVGARCRRHFGDRLVCCWHRTGDCCRGSDFIL